MVKPCVSRCVCEYAFTHVNLILTYCNFVCLNYFVDFALVKQENAVLNLNQKKVELERDSFTNEEQNILFQSSYREIIDCKRPAIRGHGYMAKYPTRAELMDAQIEQSRATAAEQEKNKHLEGEVQRLREELADQTAQTDRKVEDAAKKIQEEESIKREEMRKQMKEDMAAFFAQQTKAAALQVTYNGNLSDSLQCCELNVVVNFVLQTDTPSSTQTDCAGRQGTAGQENGTTLNSKLTRNLFPTNNRSGTNFISTQQLSKTAQKGRVTRSMTPQV